MTSLEIPNGEIGSCELNNRYGDLLPTMLKKENLDSFCVQQCSNPLCRQHCGSKVYLSWASVARFVTLKEARLFGCYDVFFVCCSKQTAVCFLTSAVLKDMQYTSQQPSFSCYNET